MSSQLKFYYLTTFFKTLHTVFTTLACVAYNVTTFHVYSHKYTRHSSPGASEGKTTSVMLAKPYDPI